MTTDAGMRDASSTIAETFTRDSSEQGAHALCALLERQVRVAACLGAPTVNDLCDAPVLLPRMAGLGTYLQHMQIVIEQLKATGTEADDVIDLFESMRDLLYAPTEIPGIPSLKRYRDYLLHGGVEPEDVELARVLSEAVDANSHRLERYIRARGGLHVDGTGRFAFPGGPSLYPLFVAIDDYAAVLQSVTNAVATYHTTKRTQPVLFYDRADQDLLRDLKRWVVRPSSDTQASTVELYQRDIKRDLSGFSEQGKKVDTDSSLSPFSVTWVRATSEGPQRRTDKFRVGPDGARQWDDGGKWRSYSEFLKAISNWSVSVGRLLYQLQAHDPTDVASSRFEFTTEMRVPDDLRTRFDVRDANGTKLSTTVVDSTLQEPVDESTEVRYGIPQIFFMTGEAGIGKTFNLVTASIDRAKSILDTDLAKPLYLYISCSGVGLKSLNQLINDAVTVTQNLNSASVLALCRNGLLVLVIDGFDELVGGAAYSDAFQLLSPLLKEVNDHGTILLSARSSYFTNQYQASLEATAFADRIPAQHFTLELKRWRRNDIKNLFGANHEWAPYRDRLTNADFELLGVPFFARAFNDFVAKRPDPYEFSTIHSVLIDSYLEREQHKLLTNTGQSVVTRGELRSVLEEVAGLIHESGRTFIDLEYFMLACGTALGLDELSPATRPTMDRMTVLCGISAASDAPAVPLFAFEHDLFYEVLLADFIGAAVQSNPDSPRIRDVFRHSVMGDATIEALVKRYTKPLAQTLLRLIPSVSVQSKADSEQVLALNVAALTSNYIAAFGRLPAAQFSHMHFDVLDLTKVQDDRVKLDQCRVDRLIVPASRVRALELVDCTIGSLEFFGDPSDATITASGDVQIDELNLRAVDGTVIDYVTNRLQILTALRKMGVQGLDDRISELQSVGTSHLEGFASEVFQKFVARRISTYVVEARSRTPGDGAERWMPVPTDVMWADLTDALEAAGLASVRTITAKGSPKVRVSLTHPPATILERDAPVDAIKFFWKAVR